MYRILYRIQDGKYILYKIKKYYINGFFKRIVEDNILSLLVCTMFLLLPLFFVQFSSLFHFFFSLSTFRSGLLFQSISIFLETV